MRATLAGPWRDLGGTLAGPWRDLGGALAGPWRDLGRTLAGPWRKLGGTQQISTLAALAQCWCDFAAMLSARVFFSYPTLMCGQTLAGPWRDLGGTLAGSRATNHRTRSACQVFVVFAQLCCSLGTRRLPTRFCGNLGGTLAGPWRGEKKQRKITRKSCTTSVFLPHFCMFSHRFFVVFFSPRQGPAKVAAKSCWQPPRPQTVQTVQQQHSNVTYVQFLPPKPRFLQRRRNKADGSVIHIKIRHDWT